VEQWKDKAACADMDSDLFMSDQDEAIKACQKCPVRGPCLEYALDTDSDGVWGGTTLPQRGHLRRRQFLLDGEIEVVWEVLD
jgi:WhiB family redox-sensing transcriptional regulator